MTPRSPQPVPATPAAPNTTTADAAWAVIVSLVKATKQSLQGKFGLTLAQAQLLVQLDPAHPEPMREVASTLGCDASNVTGLVDRLEEQGLIARHPAPSDRRVKLVVVTAAGAKLRGKLLDHWHRAPKAIASLPEKEQLALLKILKRATAEAGPAGS